MAIIYSYPNQGDPNTADKVIITDTQNDNKTKNVTIASILALGGGTGTFYDAGDGLVLASTTFSVDPKTDSGIIFDPAGVTPNKQLMLNIKSDGGVILDSGELALDLTKANIVGPLAVADGGTGAASFVNGGVLIGGGTGAVTDTGVLASGSIIIGDGAGAPVTYAAFSGPAGKLAATAGGTDHGSYLVGDMLYANTTASLETLTAGTLNHVLTSGGPGVAPAWAAPTTGTVTSVAMSGGTTGLTFTGGPVTSTGTFTAGGTLAIANGGTGQSITAYCSLSSNVQDTLPIANGGTNEVTAQAAIDALTQVSGATNEYVLTKDTVTGNALWKSNAADGENVFSPFPIYQGTTGIGTGAQSLLIQSVVDASFTCDSVKFLQTGGAAPTKDVTIGIYTGDLTAGTGVRRVYGESSGIVAGINTITFSSPYYFKAGDDIVIYFSMETPTIDPLGLTGALNNANTGLGRAAYNATPDASLATEIALGFASAGGTDRICMHFYQA